MSAFSFREDFRKVQWARTFGLNLLRAVSAGIVWAIIRLFMGGEGAGAGLPPWYMMPVYLPAVYFTFLPFFFVTAKIITTFLGKSGEAVVGLLTLFFGLVVAVGDPLVYLLFKVRPRLVPTQSFSFVNLCIILFVLDPSKV